MYNTLAFTVLCCAIVALYCVLRLWLDWMDDRRNPDETAIGAVLCVWQADILYRERGLKDV